MLEIKIMPNKDLRFTITKGDLDDLNFAGRSDTDLLSDMLEPCWSNGQYHVFSADQFGHLSEAPLIADSADCDDNGKWTLHGNVWWYPDYAVYNCMEVLRDECEVTFPFGYDADENS